MKLYRTAKPVLSFIVQAVIKATLYVDFKPWQKYRCGRRTHWEFPMNRVF